MFGICDVCCGLLMESLGCGMLRMWDVWDVASLGCRMFRVCDFRDAGCLPGFGMFNAGFLLGLVRVNKISKRDSKLFTMRKHGMLRNPGQNN